MKLILFDIVGSIRIAGVHQLHQGRLSYVCSFDLLRVGSIRLLKKRSLC